MVGKKLEGFGRRDLEANVMRKCIACGEGIKECMGFVLARDIVNRRIPIREICGKCGLIILEMDELQLIEYIGKICNAGKSYSSGALYSTQSGRGAYRVRIKRRR